MSLVSSSCPLLFSQPPHRVPTLAGTRLLIHSPIHSFIYSRVSHSSLFLTDTHSQVCPLAEALSEDNQGTCGSKDPPLNACHPISSPVCSHHYYCSLAHFFSHPAPVTCSFQIFFQFQSTEKLFTSPPPFHKLCITARTGSLELINEWSLTKKKSSSKLIRWCKDAGAGSSGPSTTKEKGMGLLLAAIFAFLWHELFDCAPFSSVY